MTRDLCCSYPKTGKEDVPLQIHDGATTGSVAEHRRCPQCYWSHDLVSGQVLTVQRTEQQEDVSVSLQESFWFALTSFTPQGGGEAPKALSSRTLVAAYWLFVVLMLATFTANLAAFLTVERMQVIHADDIHHN
ncbi:hypothetical protein J437_LFUL012100 [Ladona fulva]|uniref:Ionotropic glutamate receptor C-terminal domain-containing protein n=1 Tax=Ladona fulva TaxID=123851 RepID=A0A8K0JWM4_LADFU|nr:hypothetical protein J437_LFUL012100 [Ladona fulva]